MDLNDPRLTGKGGKRKQEEPDFNKLAPKWPFRMVVTGASGSGKTFMTLALALNHLPYKTLTCHARHLDSDLWMRFWKAIEGIQGRKRKRFAHFSETLEDLPDVDDLIKENRTLAVIDDMILSEHLDKVSEWFVRSRHKDASIIFLTQSWFMTPKLIRENCSHVAVFRGFNGHDLIGLTKDLQGPMPKQQFEHYLKTATSRPYGFAFIDMVPRRPELQFRIGFDELVLVDEEEDEK